MKTALEHLDLMDRRRGALFAQAECRDCEHYLRGCACQAEAELVRLVRGDLAEANPDGFVPGLRVTPNSDDSASKCPMFWPGFEYREELAAQDRDALLAWREDMDRLALAGRAAA